MSSFFAFVEGKKTYALVGAGMCVEGLVFAGVLTQEQANPILTMLGLGSFATLRSAVK